MTLSLKFYENQPKKVDLGLNVKIESGMGKSRIALRLRNKMMDAGMTMPALVF
jgi:hypothetical protein